MKQLLVIGGWLSVFGRQRRGNLFPHSGLRLPRVFQTLAMTVLVFAFSSPAKAACVNPAGVAGEIVYNTTHDVVQYCNGSDQWVAMTSGSGSLPVCSATPSQVAEWDGSAWACITTPSGGGSSVWSLNGAKAYYNGGNVGVGTNDPDQLLSVVGSNTSPVYVNVQNDQGNAGLWAHTTNAGSDALVYLRTDDTDSPGSAHYWHMAADGGDANKFKIGQSTSVDSTSAMTISKAGNVGIGVNDPANELHVNGVARASDIEISDATGTYRVLSFQDDADHERWVLYTDNSPESGSNAGSNFGINRYDDSGAYIASAFKINRATGNVGIGISGDPGDTLHVAGGTKLETNSVPLDFVESDQSDGFTGKYWRMPLDGGTLRFDVDDGGDGDFSPFSTALSMKPTGEVAIGSLAVSSGLQLDVEGKVGATEYCDENGSNCTAAASLGGGGGVQGTLCGLARTATGSSSYSSLATCNGSSITSSCPSGYTLITFSIGGFHANDGSGGTETRTQRLRTCAKN